MESFFKELEDVETALSAIEDELHELLTRQSSLTTRREELKALIDQNKEGEKKKKAEVWEGTDFPWTSNLDGKLKSVFKLSCLRPMQRQTMNATLAKEDTLLIMPTGGGKSLCFQLPALVDKGLTLVVSPLISLMEDQLMALEQLGVSSAMLNASSTKEDVKFVQDEMVNERGQLKLLYVTPEKLAKSKRFMNRLEKCYSLGRLARIVIDEVHCCSQWGHDFRPDYKFLGIMKRQFPSAPILGLTATATAAVLEDVKKILNIPGAFLFKASFNRPNLYYEVQQKPSSQKETMDELYHLICKRFHNLSGIVYCFSRKETEEVTVDLMSRGIKAGCYHADMDAKSRSRVHRQWLSGQVQVVVATVAFGMGIDKPDVRFVIHHSISKSMENLYQESGRAGRDDERADCIVLYRFADVARQSSMVFTEQTGLQKLHGIVKYCTDMGSCRRSMLASHFGEVWDSSHCNNMCDHCELNNQKGEPKAREVTKYCQDVLTILDSAAATEQRVTSAKLIDAWYGRGPSTLKVKSVSVPPFDKDTAERVLAQMLIKGYVQEDFHFTAYSTICYIVTGAHAANLLRRSAVKIHMDFRTKLQSVSLTHKKLDHTKKTTAARSSATSPNLSSSVNKSSSLCASNSHGIVSPSKGESKGKALYSSHKDSTPKSSSSRPTSIKNSSLVAVKSPENKVSNSQANGKLHAKEKNKKSRDADFGPDKSSHQSAKIKTSVGVCTAKDKNLGTEKTSDTHKSMKQRSEKKDCVAGNEFNDLEKEKPQQTLKRELLIDVNSDDEEDFKIKKSRYSNAAWSSIVISDGSDCENGD